MLHHDLRVDMRQACRLVLQAHGALPGTPGVAAVADPGHHAVQPTRDPGAAGLIAGPDPAAIMLSVPACDDAAVTVSRRSILALGGLAAASVAAACSRSGRPTAGPTRPPTQARTPTRAAPSSTRATSPPPARPTAARTPRHVGPAVQYAHGPRTRPQVALTFHGAGDPAIARDLLAIFAAHRAKVTVLAVGTWLEPQHALAREIVGAGHELGNHTYRHLDIDSLGARAARAEIVRCRDVLVSLVGSAGAPFPPVAVPARHARWCGRWPVRPDTPSACPTTSTPWTTPIPGRRPSGPTSPGPGPGRSSACTSAILAR